jgi:hypothetical protein
MGSCSVLVAAMSHFLKQKFKLLLLGSKRNTDLTEDEADALWTRVCVASKLLASYVPSSVAFGPPDDMRE